MGSAGHVATARRRQGIALMVLAMLSVPLVDGLAKYLSVRYSPLFLGWARYVAASLIVLPFAMRLFGRDVFPTQRPGSHLVRTVCLVAAMSLYFLAIARIPLATAASAYFVGPIIAVVLGVAMLGERMTGAKALSLALGFAGSVVILRPGGAMDLGILLALGSGVTFAFYLIATRLASQESDPIKTLTFQCVVGAALLTPLALLTWTTPAWNDLVFFVGLGLFSAVSHVLSIAAFRLADSSTLAPLVYVELIAVALIGYLAFAEIPDAATIIGATLIAAGGLILLRGPAQGAA